MKDNQRNVLKTIALLLQYPGDDLLRGVPEIESFAARLPDCPAQHAIREFMGYLTTQPLIRLQENYTAAFDMTPPTTLNMTYHLCGDGEKRAGVMACLRQVYFDAGYDCAPDELPDFLPLMLEFASVCPAALHSDLIRQCCAGLEGLAQRLRETAPQYAALLDIPAEHFKPEVQGNEPKPTRAETTLN